MTALSHRRMKWWLCRSLSKIYIHRLSLISFIHSDHTYLSKHVSHTKCPCSQHTPSEISTTRSHRQHSDRIEFSTDAASLDTLNFKSSCSPIVSSTDVKNSLLSASTALIRARGSADKRRARIFCKGRSSTTGTTCTPFCASRQHIFSITLRRQTPKEYISDAAVAGTDIGGRISGARNSIVPRDQEVVVATCRSDDVILIS
mmetsp:Transcript_2493/g.3831  ORF Transcript_2493/g.3831 Transcript_2493/m.3831 type:complete len:202 (+) Transcript_2493:714-1319(+)